MAKIANVTTRSQQIHVAEEFIQEITRVDPEERPVASAIKRGKMTSTDKSYQRHQRRAPNKNNAWLDGDTATVSARTQPTVLKAVPQIFREVVGSSGRANTVKLVGRSDEQNYQIALAYIELDMDIEAKLCSLDPAIEEVGTTPGQTASLGIHLYTNADVGATGAIAPHTTGAATTAVTAGTPRAFTANLVESAMQNSFVNSGRTPNMLVMSAKHKVQFSKFDGLAAIRDTRSHSMKDESGIVAGADYYVSNFGTLAVVPHHINSMTTHVLGLRPENNELAFLRGYQKARLGRQGDSVEDMVLVDVATCVKSERDQFVIADLT